MPGSVPARPKCGCNLKVSTIATILVAKRFAASGLSRATKARISRSLARSKATRRSLPAQRLVVVVFPAGALRRGQFVHRSRGKQPGFHVFLLDVVPGLYLPVRLAHFLFPLHGHASILSPASGNSKSQRRFPGNPRCRFGLQTLSFLALVTTHHSRPLVHCRPPLSTASRSRRGPCPWLTKRSQRPLRLLALLRRQRTPISKRKSMLLSRAATPIPLPCSGRTLLAAGGSFASFALVQPTPA